MGLRKEMIDQLSVLHKKKNKDELYEAYGDMVPDNDSEDIAQIKLELSHTIFTILYNIGPNEIEKDQIYQYFQHLEMNDELKAHSHLKTTQRTRQSFNYRIDL